jgi:hypothetical protein
VLHPSLDAHESQSQITSGKGTHSGRGPAVVLALMGGKRSSNKPLFDVVLNFDGWAIESGQSPDYGQIGNYRFVRRISTDKRAYAVTNGLASDSRQTRKSPRITANDV